MPKKKSGLFDQSKYVQQYIREKTTTKKVLLNNATDADIITWIADKNFSGYVKDLIRKDMGMDK